MLELRSIYVLLAPAFLGGCSSVTVPVLPPAASGLQPAALKEPVSQPTSQAGSAPVELASIVQGSPTDAYAKVARGALRCWFGADGPLKPTHVFHAEAKSPADGGSAEMVLHEKDDAQRDRRGSRAFRVTFLPEGFGAKVVATILKMDRHLADVMARDVDDWAKGGDDCGLRRHLKPMLTPAVGTRATPGSSP